MFIHFLSPTGDTQASNSRILTQFSSGGQFFCLSHSSQAYRCLVRVDTTSVILCRYPFTYLSGSLDTQLLCPTNTLGGTNKFLLGSHRLSCCLGPIIWPKQCGVSCPGRPIFWHGDYGFWAWDKYLVGLWHLVCESEACDSGNYTHKHKYKVWHLNIVTVAEYNMCCLELLIGGCEKGSQFPQFIHFWSCRYIWHPS